MPSPRALGLAVMLCAVAPVLAQDTSQKAAKDLPATAVYAMAPEVQLSLGTSLIGAKVTGARNEHIGHVANLVINDEGAVEAAVIAVSGILGVGERQVAVTYKSLKIVRNATGEIGHVAIAATKNDLRYAAAVLPRYAQQHVSSLR